MGSVTLALKNAAEFASPVKPGTYLFYTDKAFMVLPKNATSGLLLNIVDANREVYAQIRVTPIKKLPYPEKL